MTQPTPDTAPDLPLGEAPADDQETQRLDQSDPDSTRPMSLAELRELNLD